MRFRRAAVADVLWFIAIVLIFIVVMGFQLNFQGTQTIDTYAKNIVNSEATRFVQSIPGFSKDPNQCNMYNNDGVKRPHGAPTDIVGNDYALASANAVVNKAKGELVSNIKNEFQNHKTLKDNTLAINESDVVVGFSDETGKSTIVTITVNYSVKSSAYKAKEDGLFEKDSDLIPRKVIVTRVIENPIRFKN